MTDMTAPDRTYDAVRFHRGSRGFAAFVTGLRMIRRPAAAIAARPARPLPTPRIIQPVPLRGVQPMRSGLALYPISTPTA
jgi:hypothetical protein